MLPELEPYFAKYYDRWLDYSRRICCCLGIRNEAYDVMADTLEQFCNKSDEYLTELMKVGYSGDLKLFFSVCKGIRWTALNVIALQKKRAFPDGLDTHLFHLQAPSEETDPDEITNEEREAEAMFRNDSFTSPISIPNGITKVPIIHLRFRRRVYKDGTAYLSSCYGMEVRNNGKVITTVRRTTYDAALAAAIQYQMQHQTAQ